MEPDVRGRGRAVGAVWVGGARLGGLWVGGVWVGAWGAGRRVRRGATCTTTLRKQLNSPRGLRMPAPGAEPLPPCSRITEARETEAREVAGPGRAPPGGGSACGGCGVGWGVDGGVGGGVKCGGLRSVSELAEVLVEKWHGAYLRI